MRERDANAAPPITVLVADDSVLQRALMRFTLTSQGWAVTEAATAEAAADLVRATRPDLVLMDITFGDTGSDGLEMCAALKADPTTAAIPIVMLTAHDDPAVRAQASAAHADGFVTKPFGPLDLMNTVGALLSVPPVSPALGVYLVDAGAVDPTVLERALEEQRQLGDRGAPKRLGEFLLERGLVSSPALDRALMEQARAKVRLAENARTRILIVDDHAAVREGLKSLIGEYDDLEIVGEAADAEEGLRLARRHRPDIIVLDNEMPGRSGIDVIRELRDDVPLARIVMFSLDGAARERAIDAGAHAFIVKDAPMDQIIAALRPEGTTPRVERAGPLPPRVGQGRLRHAAVVIAAAAAAYTAVFFILESAFGAAAGAFAVIPIVMVAALLGSGAGAFAAALIIALNALLWTVTGHGVGESILTVGDPGLGIVILLLVGFGVGAMRDLRLVIDPRRARVDALAEAARAFAGVERSEVVGVFLEAVLRVVPAELAVLYSATGGEPQLVASSRALDAGMSERVGKIARGALRSSTARVIDELPEADRPLARMRSALLAPVALADQDLQGVLVLFSDHPFVAADVARSRLFAQYLWIALSNAHTAPGRAPSHVRERLS